MNIMFCLFCKEYNGLKEPCGKGKDIQEINRILDTLSINYGRESKGQFLT